MKVKNVKLTCFGKEFRKMRIDHGWSLEEVGEKVHRTPGHLCALETGKRTVSDKFLKGLAEELDLNEQETKRLKIAAYYSKMIFTIDLRTITQQHRMKAREALRPYYLNEFEEEK